MKYDRRYECVHIFLREYHKINDGFKKSKVIIILRVLPLLSNMLNTQSQE